MLVTDQIEQESIDLSIWGSADGENWGSKPILKLPQRFYRGETRAVLELVYRPDVKFIRARWDLNRWGRVAPLPMFRVGLHPAEGPALPPALQPEALSAAPSSAFSRPVFSRVCETKSRSADRRSGRRRLCGYR